MTKTWQDQVKVGVLDVGIGEFTECLQNRKLKPCQGDKMSPTNDVIHTKGGLFSSEMKDVLNGGF